VPKAITRNSKMQQLQANERLVAGDDFMLNLISVLHHLISKVKEFCEQQEKGKEQNSPTECWFLTLQAHHIGILPIIERFDIWPLARHP
jgi:ubiquitin conjugation factor E4 B